MRRAAIIAGLSLALAFPVVASATQVGITGSVPTIRPEQTIPLAQTIDLHGARNEFVSFQVPVRADTGALNGVTVSLQQQFRTAGGAQTIPGANVRFYREDYYTVTRPSDGEIYQQDPCPANCRQPDILIPERDVIYEEDRNAFPVNVPAGENRVAWIDVLIPQNQAPGQYQGTIRVTSGATVLADLTVNLEVIPFTLPSTSSLEGAFATNPNKICPAHGNCANTPGGGWEMYANYARLGLENRIGLSNPSFQAPTAGATAQFNQYGLPYIKGTSPARLPGARIETVLLNVHEAAKMADWKSKGAAEGFLDRITFFCDEIHQSPGLWSSLCDTPYQTARNNWNSVGPASQLPTAMIGSIFDLNWGRSQGYAVANESVDTLIPLPMRMHSMNPGWGPYPGETTRGNQRHLYDAFLNDPDNRLWMYVSCMSEGCDDPQDPSDDYDPHWRYFGWPSYAIDQFDGEARAMAWQVFNYKTTGEYYFETVQSLGNAYQPGGQFAYGAQGDGNLFYPGTVARIGGTKDVPVESRRLKQIRDGREDYEYLLHLKNTGQEVAARAVAGGPYATGGAGLFENMYDSDKGQAAYDAARGALEDLVIGNAAVPPDTLINAGPSGTTTSTSAEFTFASVGAATAFECSLDDAPFTPCVSPKSYGGLGPGGHSFRVRATNANGTDATPAARNWTIVGQAETCDGLPATIVGSLVNLRVEGTAGPDVIVTPEGEFEVFAGAGDDLICAGSGYDTIRPGPGSDRVFMGGSSNAIDYSDASQPVRVDLAAGTAVELADQTTDTFQGASEAFGGPGNDHLLGTAARDFLAGNGGDDVIEGRGGNDLIWGDADWSGPGDDSIDPGPGPDTVIAGPGADSISAADGEPDSVDCGEGQDSGSFDAADALAGCETAGPVVPPVVCPNGSIVTDLALCPPAGGPGPGASNRCLAAGEKVRRADRTVKRIRSQLKRAKRRGDRASTRRMKKRLSKARIAATLARRQRADRCG